MWEYLGIDGRESLPSIPKIPQKRINRT